MNLDVKARIDMKAGSSPAISKLELSYIGPLLGTSAEFSNSCCFCPTKRISKSF